LHVLAVVARLRWIFADQVPASGSSMHANSK
jgi:hypothetical protein